MAVVGPRTVQYRQQYSVFVTAIDYDEGTKDDVVVSLTGNNLGEEISSKKFDLEFISDKVTFDVSIILRL